MTTMLGLAGAVGLASLVYMLVVLGRLSRRLGEVVKMPPLYRRFYLAAGLVGWAVLVQVLSVGLAADLSPAPGWLGSATVHLAARHIPMALGLLLGLVTAWRYWGWLLRER